MKRLTVKGGLLKDQYFKAALERAGEKWMDSRRWSEGMAACL